MEWFKTGERVRIFNPKDGGKEYVASGYVVGHGATEECRHLDIISETTSAPMVLVSLDTGFYNDDVTLFVRILVCHPESLERA